MSLQAALFAQFRKPEGALGYLAGLIMANRASNRTRGAWTVDQLALAPSHRVLELGCGPGVALARCLDAGASHVVGLDHSPVMISQARRRLATAMAGGRAALQLGGLETLAADSAAYDRIFSVNVVQFLPDLDAALAILHRALRPGGRCATTYQPRHRNPTRADALRLGAAVEKAMARQGFVGVRLVELPLTPVTICVLGERAAD